MPDRRPAVVLPVRDGADLIEAALVGIVPAAHAVAGLVVVVDDGSRDGTADLAAAAGADVVRLGEPVGPYAARNAGWRRGAAQGADVAVFVDVRCRPRPGWLPNLLAALDGDGAAMAAGQVTVIQRAHLAGRAAARLEPLALRHGRDALFLPYAPTCHLAVPTDVLDAVDGFRPVRGGGDVDLCWRVQLAGLGHLAWAEDAVLDWEPRHRVRDLLAQHRRYGANGARLRHEFRPQGCPAAPATPSWRVAAHGVREWGRAIRHERPADWGPVTVAAAARLAQDLSFSRQARRQLPLGAAR